MRYWMKLLKEIAGNSKHVTLLEGDRDANMIGLDGINGSTVIIGYGGPDTLFGGNGIDVLLGGSGTDSINGGNGNDYLRGGRGDDFMAGGNGKDIFHCLLGSDVVTGGNGVDTFIFKPREKGGEDNDLTTITDYDCDVILINRQADVTVEDVEGGALVAVGDNKIAFLQGASADEVQIEYGRPDLVDLLT